MLHMLRKTAQWPLPRIPIEIEQYPWMQVTFDGDQPLEEVRRMEMTLSGDGAYVSNGRLRLTAYPDYATLPKFLAAIGEDFTIETKFRLNAHGSDCGLLGVWSGVNSSSSWVLHKNTTDNKLYFRVIAEDGSSESVVLASDSPVPMGTDLHVAIVRHNNVIRMYVEGSVQSQTAITNQPFRNSAQDIRTRLRNATSAWFDGELWDIRISRYALYVDNFVPSPLQYFVRPKYTPDALANVIAQLQFAVGGASNEVDGVSASFTQASSNGSQLVLNNHAAALVSMPVDFDGIGDFTVEATCVVSSGTNLAAQLFSIGSVGVAYQYNSNKLVVTYFPAWPSTSGGQTFTSTADFPRGLTQHLVLERNGDTITLYADMTIAVRFTYAGTLPSTYLNFTSASSSPSLNKRVWNARFTKGAVYGDTGKLQNFFPRTGFGEWKVHSQYGAALLKSVPNTERSDQKADSFIIQVLVKS